MSTKQTKRVVPQWKFEPRMSVLVRHGNRVYKGKVSEQRRFEAEWYDENVVADLPYSTALNSGRVVPRTREGVDELKRQLACLEGEIASTRDWLDGLEVTE